MSDIGDGAGPDAANIEAEVSAQERNKLASSVARNTVSTADVQAAFTALHNKLIWTRAALAGTVTSGLLAALTHQFMGWFA